MSLSFNELIIVVAVSILILKPEDIKNILKQLISIKNYIKQIYDNIIKEFQLIEDTILEKTEIDEMNFYLKKISELGKEYKGEYDLSSVKKYYFNILKKLKLQ